MNESVIIPLICDNTVSTTRARRDQGWIICPALLNKQTKENIDVN